MTTATTTPISSPLTRVLDEGYGPGAWHGADMKAALADVTPAIAFWRPGKCHAVYHAGQIQLIKVLQR